MSLPKCPAKKMVKDGKCYGGDLSELKQIKPKPTAVALCVSGSKPLNLRRSQSQSKSVKPMRAEFRLGIRLDGCPHYLHFPAKPTSILGDRAVDLVTAFRNVAKNLNPQKVDYQV